ncbi:MAG: FkbM family methyltransferase [Metallosphaera sp.]
MEAKKLLGAEYGDLGAVFEREDYKWLKPEGKVVLDIGASIGDSAIWFAEHGAKYVIGLEPYPYVYSLALENVKGYKNIVMLNMAYGKPGEIEVTTEPTYSGTPLRPGKGKKIKVVDLPTLVEMFNLENAVLKMDCEGCEDNLFHDLEGIFAFTRIQIEYHHQNYVDLAGLFNSIGYEVTVTEPREVWNERAGEKMWLGYIYAERVQGL